MNKWMNEFKLIKGKQEMKHFQRQQRKIPAVQDKESNSQIQLAAENKLGVKGLDSGGLMAKKLYRVPEGDWIYSFNNY